MFFPTTALSIILFLPLLGIGLEGLVDGLGRGYVGGSHTSGSLVFEVCSLGDRFLWAFTSIFVGSVLILFIYGLYKSSLR